MSDKAPSCFIVTVKDEKPRVAFDIIEMQGEVVFSDPACESNPLPSPMGTLQLPENGKNCTLRMGTLALAGEVGNVKTPLLVLRRVTAEGAATKRPREVPAISSTHPPMLISDAWKQGLLDGDDSHLATSNVQYEVVGTVQKRYHFKSKATRQFNK